MNENRTTDPSSLDATASSTQVPHKTAPSKTVTIGVFDSGFGGLTVLRELLPLIPGAHYLYLGDTARLPYGSKSPATIARYAVESARYLESHGAERLVVACNTASALAMNEIVQSVAIPVTGVIEPAVRMTQARYKHANTLILATTATVQSHAYRKFCLAKGLSPTEKACPLLVPLIEEGWVEHPVTRDVLRIYLREALAECSPEVVILGCTHYPLIAPLMAEMLQELGSDAEVLNSAQATAQVVSEGCMERGPGSASIRSAADSSTSDRSTSDRSASGASATGNTATFECYATDSVEKFARLGGQFLGRPIAHVELLDLGG